MDDSKQILKESDPEEALSELEDVYTEKTADPADEPDLSAAEESPLSDDIDQEADPIESDPTAESESVTAMTPPVPEKVSRLNKKTVTLSVILVSVLLSVFALVYFAVSRNAPVRLPEKTEEQQDSEFVSDGDSFSIDDLTDNVIGVGVLFEDAKVFDKADGKEVGKLSGGTTLMIFAADNDYYRVTDMEKTLTGYVKKAEVNTGGIDIGNPNAEEIVDDETGEVIEVIDHSEPDDPTKPSTSSSVSQKTTTTKKATTTKKEAESKKATTTKKEAESKKTTTTKKEAESKKTTTTKKEAESKKTTTTKKEAESKKTTTTKKEAESKKTTTTKKEAESKKTTTTKSTQSAKDSSQTTAKTTTKATTTTTKPTKKSTGLQPEDFPVNSSPYFVYVEKGSHTITIYAKDSHGKYTTAMRTYLTATGRTASLTPVGLFSVGGKEKWHRWGNNAYSPYCSKYYNGLFFHGPIYKKMNFGTLKEGSVSAIGTNASSGCMRTSSQAAYFIYAFCPSGTYVKIVNGSPLGKGASRPTIKSQYVDPATNKVPVAGVSVKTESKTIKIGEKFTVKAIISPDNASEKACYWISSNPKVATVKGSGLSSTVTAVGSGKAVITVTTVDGSYKATVNVTVAEPTTTTTTTKATETTTTTTKATQSTTKATESTQSTTKATESTQSTTKATESTKSTTKATESTKSTTKATEPTKSTTKATESTKSTTKATESTKSTTKATEPTKSTTKATEPTKSTTKATEPTKSTTKATEPTKSTTKATEPTKSTTKATEPTKSTTKATEPTKSTTKATETTQP